jgi:hypothetical protein
MGFIDLQIEWNPWLGGYRPQIPVLSALYPQLNLLNPPPRKKIWATEQNCSRFPDYTVHHTQTTVYTYSITASNELHAAKLLLKRWWLFIKSSKCGDSCILTVNYCIHNSLPAPVPALVVIYKAVTKALKQQQKISPHHITHTVHSQSEFMKTGMWNSLCCHTCPLS